MRISDWSSDVCSSDLAENAVLPEGDQISGLIRVHTSLTFAKYQLAPILSLLLNRFPGLRVEFVIGTERGDFLERDIDVAIHSGNPTEMSLEIGRAHV